MVQEGVKPVLIAAEAVPAMLQLVGKEIEELTQTFNIARGTFHEVVQCLYNQTRQLWVLPDESFQIHGWMITKLDTLADGTRRLTFDLIGGHDLDGMLKHLPAIEDWAKEFGVTEAVAYARPGLRKKLKTEGFFHTCDVVYKPLTDQVN